MLQVFQANFPPYMCESNGLWAISLDGITRQEYDICKFSCNMHITYIFCVRWIHFVAR